MKTRCEARPQPCWQLQHLAALRSKNDVVADALADGQRTVRIKCTARPGSGGSIRDAWACKATRPARPLLNLAGQFDRGDPQAADPIDRLSCRPDFCVLMCPWPNQHTIDQFPLSKDSPPTFIASARDNKIANSFAVEIGEKLKSQGVAEQLFIVDRGGHGTFHYGMSDQPGPQWPTAPLAWLKQIGMWQLSGDSRPTRFPPTLGTAAVA